MIREQETSAALDERRDVSPPQLAHEADQRIIAHV
jgi:hypothetical protein